MGSFIIPFLVRGKYKEGYGLHVPTLSYDAPQRATQLAIGYPETILPRQYFRKTEVLVGTFWKEYGFVGCVRKMELRISFEPFLRPFESDLWIVLFLVSVVVAWVSWILL